MFSCLLLPGVRGDKTVTFKGSSQTAAQFKNKRRFRIIFPARKSGSQHKNPRAMGGIIFHRP